MMTLDRSCSFDNYYEAYGHGSYLANFNEQTIKEVFIYLQDKKYSYNIISFTSFKNWFYDGWNAFKGNYRIDTILREEAAFVGYLKYCDNDSYNKICEVISYESYI